MQGLGYLGLNCCTLLCQLLSRELHFEKVPAHSGLAENLRPSETSWINWFTAFRFFSCVHQGLGHEASSWRAATNWILMSCSFNNQPNREARMGRLQKAFDMRHLTYQIFLTCNIWISHWFISSWVWCIIDVVNWFLTSWQVNTVQ